VIPAGFIEDLLSRVDIVEVVGRHVELRKAGASHVGLCPFHAEKTPSFNVIPAKQFYHCFGCGANGDAIRFLVEHGGAGFREAVEELAQQVGMAIPDTPIDPAEHERALANKARKATLSDVLQCAADHYRVQLKAHPAAIDYLKRRGLSGEIARRFGLGYAAAGWRNLASAFARYDDPLLVDSGLVIVQGDEGPEQKRYDRFRDRIVFPIRSVMGEVIGFGGRVLDAGEPKYLNSPETALFVKGRELYGLFEARTAMRAKGYALVVEGYMDVVALAQHGLGNAVATLGTACTPEHIQKLFRFTDSVVFSFDGDAAGRRAANRALEAALPHASDLRTLRFLFLPSQHDPDSFVREHGAEAFESAVVGALPLSAQLIAWCSEGCDLDTAEGRARLLAAARPLWSALPESGMLKKQLLGELAALTRLPPAELNDLWRPPAHTPAVPVAPTRPRPTPSRRLRHQPSGPADQALRMLLLHHDWWDRLNAEDHELLHSLPEPHGALFAWIEREFHEHGALANGALQSALAEAGHAELVARLMNSMAAHDIVEFDDLRTIVKLLWRQHWVQRSEALAALGAGDPSARRELQQVLARLKELATTSPVKP
jgi:DNA primase